nr:immunoglobulin heavy chain junction region [Mus musculus]
CARKSLFITTVVASNAMDYW